MQQARVVAEPELQLADGAVRHEGRVVRGVRLQKNVIAAQDRLSVDDHAKLIGQEPVACEPEVDVVRAAGIRRKALAQKAEILDSAAEEGVGSAVRGRVDPEVEALQEKVGR